VRQDGIHFETMRYLDLTLAAYVGEWVTIRYDPQDMAEIRVYHHDRFLCRAVCQELAGETISLKELIRTRDARRRELRATLTDRAALLDQLLGAPQQPPPVESPEPPVPAPPRPPRLKRYVNE
jgi:putative transposase